jgi:ribosomal-protein-alanine N-acetyltransferase
VTVRDRDAEVILESERLVLRRQREDDVEFLVDLWTDPDVTRHLGGSRDRDELRFSLEETAAHLFAERFDLWPVVDKATGRLVGHGGLLDKEIEGVREIELICVLAVSAWGKAMPPRSAALSAGTRSRPWG